MTTFSESLRKATVSLSSHSILYRGSQSLYSNVTPFSTTGGPQQIDNVGLVDGGGVDSMSFADPVCCYYFIIFF